MMDLQTIRMAIGVRTIPNARWAPEKRLEFIEFRLQWDRTINRADLIDFFGISQQQASADLARYQQFAPNNLEYDRSAKTYQATPAFRPRFIETDSNTYLSQLADVVTGRIPVEACMIGRKPSCDVLHLPVRTIDPATLLRVNQAIRQGNDLQVLYQSMRRPEVKLRWIAPHALASDGLRWHTRAWCCESGTYKDFVLSRIQAVEGDRPRNGNLPIDAAWDTFIDIVIRARSELSPTQRAAIEAEYDMSNGRFVMRCRKALAFYLLRLMHLDSDTSTTPVIQQPLEVEHSNELADVIAAARKTPETARIDDAPTGEST